MARQEMTDEQMRSAMQDFTREGERFQEALAESLAETKRLREEIARLRGEIHALSAERDAYAVESALLRFPS